MIAKIPQLKLKNALVQWREFAIRDAYSTKLQNAAAMVDKMSKFSRTYVSLNALSSIVLKNRNRTLSKAFVKWSKTLQKQSSSTSALEEKLAQKEQEIKKMEHMFREYNSWR